MTDNDTANMRGQWRLEAAGLHMRADNTEAGKLVRLADVVLWLIEARELPRKVAVATLCDALDAASPAPALFLAQSGDYAVSGDGETFGYHTAESHRTALVVADRAAREDLVSQSPEYAALLERMQSEHGRYDPATPIQIPRGFGFSSAFAYAVPGVQSAVRLLRDRWLSLSGTKSDADAFAHAKLPGRAIAVRVTDAARLWGWGSAQVVVDDVDQWTGARLLAEKASLITAGRSDHTQRLVKMTGLKEREIRRRISEHEATNKPSPLPSVRVLSGKRRA